jgi:Arc/MetJ-type ribon-helix-helix transcriptional regulator
MLFGRSKAVAKVMVSFPSEFLRKVDRVARLQGRTRSELIRHALRVTLGEASNAQSWKDAIAPLRELEGKWVGEWDSTDLIRYYRDRRYGEEDRR